MRHELPSVRTGRVRRRSAALAADGEPSMVAAGGRRRLGASSYDAASQELVGDGAAGSSTADRQLVQELHGEGADEVGALHHRLIVIG